MPGLLAIIGSAVAAGLGVATLHATMPAAQNLSGAARVIDGDTIVINGTHIRLAGVDSPERSQTCEGRDGNVYECGRDASAVMVELNSRPACRVCVGGAGSLRADARDLPDGARGVECRDGEAGLGCAVHGARPVSGGDGRGSGGFSGDLERAV